MNENANGERGMLHYDFHGESFDNYIKRLEDTFKGRNISDLQKVMNLFDTLGNEVHSMLENSREADLLFIDSAKPFNLTYNELKRIVRNVIQENPSLILQRYKFLNRKQQVGESMSSYLISLRKLIKNCRYPPPMVDVVLRDTFISGIQSRAILGKLLAENDISLEKAISLAKSLEASNSRISHDKTQRERAKFCDVELDARSTDLNDSWDDCSDSRASHSKKDSSKRLRAKLLNELRTNCISLENSLSSAESPQVSHSRTSHDKMQRERAKFYKEQLDARSKNANDSWDDWSVSRASHSKKDSINPPTQQSYVKSRNANDSWDDWNDWDDWSDSKAHSNKKPNNPRTQSNMKSRPEVDSWDDDWSNLDYTWNVPSKNRSKVISTDFTDDWETLKTPNSDPWRPWDDRRRMNSRENTSWERRGRTASDLWSDLRPKTSPTDSSNNPKKVIRSKADSSNHQPSKNRPQTNTSRANWPSTSSTSPVDSKKNETKPVLDFTDSWDDEIVHPSVCHFRSRTSTYKVPDTKKTSSADSKETTAKPVTGSTDSSNPPCNGQPQSTTPPYQPTKYGAKLVAELNNYSYMITLQEPNQSNNSTTQQNSQPSTSQPQIPATAANPKTTSVDSKGNETAVTSSADLDDVTCLWHMPKTELQKPENRARIIAKIRDTLRPQMKRDQPPNSTNPPNEPSTSPPQACAPSQVNEISTSQPQENTHDEPCSSQAVTNTTTPRQNPLASTSLETTLPDLPIAGSRTEKFRVRLPGSVEQEDCSVTLEWYGDERTRGAVLRCSPTYMYPYEEFQAFSLDLYEVTCVLENGKHEGLPHFSLPTTKNIEENVSPLTLYSKPSNGAGGLILYISTVWERIHDMPRLPRERSIWATTCNGDLYVTDTSSLLKNQNTFSNKFMKEYSTQNHAHPFRMPLPNGFTKKTEITINGYVHQNAERFYVNLVCGHNEDIAFHFNPRFHQRVIVRNSHIEGEWGDEERNGGFNMDEESQFILTISCMEKKIKIILNGSTYMYYRHRVSPELITDIEIGGQADVSGILYESKDVILDVQDLLWRKVKSGFRKVESCSAGVTWAMDMNGSPIIMDPNNDSPIDKCWFNIIQRAMKDFSICVQGDVDGSERIAVWAVDEFRGEVLYRYGITTMHPCGGGLKVVISGERMVGISCGGNDRVWCFSENGTCFWRAGITATNPIGESWRPIKPPNGCTLEKIAVGKMTVWVIDNKGDLFVRKEITPLNPGGIYWRKVLNKDDNRFEHIQVSDENIWGVTKKGVICRRTGISADNPEGVSWNYGLSGNWLHVSE